MLSFRVLLITMVVGCALSAPAFAQDEQVEAAPPDDRASSDELDLANLLEFTIESASRQKEPLKEAPVPVTVITSEMIRSVGARNLKDVLTAYVPGMTPIIDHNESNVAMRGIYASSQQKILVMIDGRRLNQRAYLAAATGFGTSINPDKVAQIEVLRGPGSSVYGNVALSAVVNIVTKKGKDIDGMKVRVGGGNFGQLKSDIAYGKTFDEDHELVMYGSVFHATGEEFSISERDSYVGSLDETPVAGVAIIDGVTQPLNYDFGLRYRLGDLTLVAQTRFDKHTEPYTAVGRTGDVYDEDELRTVRDVGPGLGMRGHSLGASYAHELVDGLTLNLDVGYDSNSVESSAATTNQGGGVYLAWDEQALYGILSVRYDYTLGGLGDGNILAGAHVDWWTLTDSILISGTGGELTNVADTSGSPLLLGGSEASYSGFIQLKQRLWDLFIVNVGGRFDYKTRRNNSGNFDTEPPEVDDVTVFSPRAALIFTPSSTFDVKLSFADSFVDSPYWYRYTTLATYAGAFDLRPEKLRSVQLTPSVTLLDGRLRTTLNGSWNSLTDGIYRVPDAVLGQDAFYNNAGRLDSISVEAEIAFVLEWLRVTGNYTYFQVLEAEEYTAFNPDSPRPVVNDGELDGKVWNVPQFYGNLMVDVNPVRAFAPNSILANSWIHLRIQHLGARQSPIQRVSQALPDANANILNEESDTFLLHLGVRAQDIYFKGLGFSVFVNNVLDERWFLGGSTPFPYPQAGRWVLATLELEADL